MKLQDGLYLCEMSNCEEYLLRYEAGQWYRKDDTGWNKKIDKKREVAKVKRRMDIDSRYAGD